MSKLLLEMDAAGFKLIKYTKIQELAVVEFPNGNRIEVVINKWWRRFKKSGTHRALDANYITPERLLEGSPIDVQSILSSQKDRLTERNAAQTNKLKLQGEKRFRELLPKGWVLVSYDPKGSLVNCPNHHSHQYTKAQRVFKCLGCRSLEEQEILNKEKEQKKTRGSKYSLADIHAKLAERGFRTEIEEYPKHGVKFEIIGPDGKRWMTSFNYLIKGFWPDAKGIVKEETKEKALSGFKSENYATTGRYINSVAPVDLICPNGHPCSISWNKFSSCGVRCPECMTNKPESDIGLFLSSLNVCFHRHDRNILDGRELDIVIPEHKLAIEYCGLYWHSTSKVERNYHRKKLLTCKEKGYRLLTIYEDEWLYRREIVESIIAGKLQRHRVHYARKLSFCKMGLNEAIEFVDRNHLQGAKGAYEHAYGLVSPSGELVGAALLNKHHRQNSKDLVLSRLCFAKMTSVIGGTSKMVNNIYNDLGRPFITYADRRYSEGDSYTKSGFVLEAELPPDYDYIKGKKRRHKQTLKKTVEERDTGKTEEQLRLEQGWHRIYDCGKYRFRYDKGRKPGP